MKRGQQQNQGFVRSQGFASALRPSLIPFSLGFETKEARAMPLSSSRRLEGRAASPFYHFLSLWLSEFGLKALASFVTIIAMRCRRAVGPADFDFHLPVTREFLPSQNDSVWSTSASTRSLDGHADWPRVTCSSRASLFAFFERREKVCVFRDDAGFCLFR